MGMFFSPGLPAINTVKLCILVYVRSWAVLTANIPHETVFRASRSNNFYYALLLIMLFLCTLPVGFACVWLEPSWHCGPFSSHRRIYNVLTSYVLNALPKFMVEVIEYLTSPGVVIPLLLLLILIIYYLVSLTGSLREANNDLKMQLRREKNEREKPADAAKPPEPSIELPEDPTKWSSAKKILPVLPNKFRTSNQLLGEESDDSHDTPTKKTAKFGINKSVVSRALKAFQTTGTAVRKIGGGRPRTTTAGDDRCIILQMKRGRQQSASAIAQQLSRATRRQVSRFTVARRIQKGGLFAHRPVETCPPMPPFTGVQRAQKLDN
ncbi:transmembrane channel-like protein 3 [Trichonephila clavipes]|nr:transmembrane channel-like protein 3 [Trichonephila clavipes]